MKVSQKMCILPSVVLLLCLLSPLAKCTTLCEPIKVEMCSAIGYHLTALPNLAEQNLQADAKYELETFAPLIQSGCSSQLQFFLCSVYVPMCSPDIATQQRVIGPCRPLCQRVKQDCVPVLEDFGYSWPKVLNCTKFPETQEHNHICMEGPAPTEDDGEGSRKQQQQQVTPDLFNTLQTNPLFREKVKESLSSPTENLENNYNLKKYRDFVDMLDNSPGLNNHVQEEAACPSGFEQVSRLNRCVPRCNGSVLYMSSDKQIADIVMGLFASLSFLASLFVVVSFMVGGGTPFLYPERSLVFVAFSCFGHSLGHLLRMVLGRDAVSCQGGLLSVEGHRDAHCFLVFIFVYFFSSAVSAWWTVTAVNWCLSATFGWRHSRFRAIVSWCHLIGWGVPAALTVAALVMHKIDADELTGLCGVGFQNSISLLYFVIVPESLHFVVGLAMSVTAVIASFCCCCSGQTEDSPSARLERVNNLAVFRQLRLFAVFYSLAKVSNCASIVLLFYLHLAYFCDAF
jgi:hypothetical protein